MLYLLITVILIAALFVAGCSSTPGEPAPVPTAVQTLSPTDSPVSSPLLTPGPIGTMPPGRGIEVTIQRDPIQLDIDVIFNGGAGINSITRLDATMYASDGRIVEKTIDRPITMGKEITFEGTRGTDRIKVVSYYNTGDVIVINDALFEYKKSG